MVFPFRITLNAWKESDILVAVDGEAYREGPAKLNEKFIMEAGDEAKWLLTFWRDGELFDILLNSPIQSQFLDLPRSMKHSGLLNNFLATFTMNSSAYENFEIYRDRNGVCDVLSLEKDPLSALLPILWCMKYRLFIRRLVLCWPLI